LGGRRRHGKTEREGRTEKKDCACHGTAFHGTVFSRFDRNLRELEGIFERYYFDARWRSRPASRARCNRMRRPR
jgi:hypothetical protein